MSKRGKIRRIGSLAMTAVPIFARALRGAKPAPRPRTGDHRARPVPQSDTAAAAASAAAPAATHPEPAEIHLPHPSIWPAAVAFGVTLVFFGFVTSYGFSIVGGLVTLFAIGAWIGELRHG